ncbi:glucan endo-1,3-beta-glucosidase 11 [Aristolochia californica]|uniref:glucan endo-1,3-beta-glucosidase 11 n=1 Tax=Aristolochia californica TaxID=171875 RepID=UPI0035E2F6E6
MASLFSSLITLLLVSSGSVILPTLVSSIGINYGQVANNLPSPENVAPLLQSIGVKKVKLYDSNPRVLRAFANTGVEFIVGLANECLDKMQDQSKAVAWVKENVQCYLPATKITTITVGNEILTGNDKTMMENLLPAIQNIHAALISLGLDKQISVTTTHSLAVLQTSYPPSAGAFRPDLRQYISPILSFHSKTGSPFLINAYPFFAYKANPKEVSLDFALFQPNQGIVDSTSNLHYDNMLHAQIDAVYAALALLGYGKLPVHISETGWPSKGDADEVGATLDNARKYNGNLMKLLSEKKGTPLRPNQDLDVYVFALFNENLKHGPTSERNYGLFKPDGTPVYQLAASSGNGSSSTGSGGGTAVTPFPGDSSTPGFFNISFATGSQRCDMAIFLLGLLFVFWTLFSL